MDNKIIGELLSLVRRAKLSDKDKKLYTAFIELAEEKMRNLGNDPKLMEQLFKSYKKKKKIMKSQDRDAWEKLMKEEEKEIEAMVAEEK